MSSSEAFTGLTSQNISFSEFNPDSVILTPDQKSDGLYIKPSTDVPGRPSDITGYILTCINSQGKVAWEEPTEQANVPGQGNIWFSDASGDPIGDSKFNWNTTTSTLLLDGIINLRNDSGQDFTIQSSNSQVPASLFWILPPTNGTNDQVLTTDGTGVLGWTSKGGGGQVVPGQGNVWFSDNLGSPVGSTGNFVWDETNKYLTAGDRLILNNSTFQFTLTPDTLTGDINWTLPADNPIAGYVLSNDGSGVLSWIKNTVEVPGVNYIWFSDASGDPIGENEFQYITASNTLQLIGTMRLQTGSFYTDISAGTQAGNIDLILPTVAASTGQILQGSPTGQMTWIDNLNVSGQGNIWFSDSNGDPIGSSDINWDGSTLNIVGGGEFDTVELRQGLNTITLQAQATLVSSYTLQFPNNAGGSGQVLSTNGTGVLSWVTINSVEPGGNNGNVQYKNGTSFAGSDDFNWDGITLSVSNGTNTAEILTDTLTIGASFTVDNAGLINATGLEIANFDIAATGIVTSDTNITITNGSNNATMSSNILTVGASFDVTNAGVVTANSYLLTDTPTFNIDSFGNIDCGDIQASEVDCTSIVMANSGITSGGVISGTGLEIANFDIDAAGVVTSDTNITITNGSNNATMSADILNVGAEFNVANTGVVTAKSYLLDDTPTFNIDSFGNIDCGDIQASEVDCTSIVMANSGITSGGVISGTGLEIANFDIDAAGVVTSDANMTLTNGSNDATLDVDVLFVGPNVIINNSGSISGATNLVLQNGVRTVTMSVDATQTPNNIAWTFPVDAGLNGYLLQTDGAGALSWVANSGVPGGADTQVQFNNAGSFGGSSSFTWDGTSVGVGNIVLNSSTDTITADTVTTTSDYRLKENIKELNNLGSLELVCNVKTYEYNLKGNKKKSYGVIAQELEKFTQLTQMVVNNPVSGDKSVDYIQLIPLLIGAVQELSREVKSLKQQWN